MSFAVLEGLQQVLRDVTTEGATRTDEDVVRRALRLRLGTPVNLGDWSQARKRLYDTNVFRQVDIEPVPGELTDHYSPEEKVLRLSPDVYEGRSLAALGIAAHEAGHAIQDARRYPLLALRNGLVPLANIGGSIGWLMIAAGLVLAMSGLVWAGIAVFSAT